MRPRTDPEARLQLIACCLVLFGGLLGGAQITFRSDVKLVNILATVRDGDGRIVAGLGRDQFTLQEDGKPQTIHDFVPQSDLALTLGLLVDTSGSMHMVLDQEQTASVAFLKNALRPDKDRAMIVHFDTEVETLSGIEASHKRLSDAVHRIRPTPLTGPISLLPARTTALYDAIVEAASVLQSVQGRKALVVLSDGVDVESNHSLNDTVDAALRSDTAIYTVLISSSALAPDRSRANAFPPSQRNRAVMQHYAELNLARGRSAMSRLSSQTGGGLFEANAEHSFKSIFEELTDELRNQYRIGLICEGEGCAPGYHSLSLATTQSGLRVQSRRAFFVGGSSETDSYVSTALSAEASARNGETGSAAPAPKSGIAQDPVLSGARNLALRQRELGVGFLADERIECYTLGNETKRECDGTANIVFDKKSRTIKRQIDPGAAVKVRTAGVTGFGEFGVELSNIFRTLSLWQFQRTGHTAPFASGLEEYDFNVDGKSSSWQIWDGERWLAIPYIGSIWIEPSEYRIVRLQRTSAHLPPGMLVSLVQSQLEFSPATIGGDRVPMLPTHTVERICYHGDDACTEIFSTVRSYLPQPADVSK